MARCRVKTFQHNDTGHLEHVLKEIRSRDVGTRTRALVIVDGVYSMDGDIAPIDTIVAIKDRHGAFLMVDDSHAIGVVGSGGRGTAALFGVPGEAIDVLTASAGKAIPSCGGFVAGNRALVTYLQHGSSPAMFSSAINASSTAAILEALAVIDEEPQHLTRMWRNTARLRRIVESHGLDVAGSRTPIVPVILGSAERAYVWSRQLLAHGIHTSAIPHPAVPAGTSRLRLCATAAHEDTHFAALDRALQQVIAAEQRDAARITPISAEVARPAG